MSSQEETILALQEVVGNLLARIQSLEDANGGGGGSSNVPMGLRLSDFQRDLPDISNVPDGNVEGDMLVWDGSQWVATTQEDVFSPYWPPSDGDLLIWDSDLGRWVSVATTSITVVTGVTWDGDSLKITTRPVLVITAGDAAESTVFTAVECE